MEEIIEDRIEEHFNENLKIEVVKPEIRTYKIDIKILNDKITIIYKWDYKLTEDANICYLISEIERAILNYFRR